MISTKAFKAYDIRGIVPEEVNEDLAYRLGRALAWKLKAKKLVLKKAISDLSAANSIS